MPRRKKENAVPEVKFTNLEKVFFPATGFTKGDLIRYYVEIAPALIPHFRERPVTLIRMPDGVKGDRFYEKNAPGHTPDWVHTTIVPKSEGGEINYITIDDAPTLAWCANNGAVEFHPFLHRKDDLVTPTHMAFDLDPGEGADLVTCIEVGFIIRDLLGRLKLDAYPKVTGSKGLQLYVPLNTDITYATITPFAKAIAELLHKEHPKLIVSDMSKALRVERVFIDWSQNHSKKTTVGPYSVRGKRDEPYVSMPVTWDELRRAQKAGKPDGLFFSPADALKRYRKLGDLFAPVLNQKQRLPGQPKRDAPPPRAPRSLQRYAEKRDFTKTPEPGPALPTRSAQGSRRRFVVQKHAASHLHYDFRLEMHDVLKSWAVPKGLSTEVGVKRSAFQTEDHPLRYFDFEGTIPEGEYGGGTVMVWDVGTYDIIEGNYWQGRLKVWLSGKKLKGEWHLNRIKSDDEKPVWLIQKADKAAKPITKKQESTSVLTGRTMEQIAAAKDAVWENSGEAWERSKRSPAKKARATALPPKPEFVEPMLARLVGALPDGPEWRYEIKWDGWRGLGVKHGDDAHLFSRNAKSLDADFPQIVEALKTLPVRSALVDGEVVALDEHGKPTFGKLVRGRSDVRIVFYAFDLLSLDGNDWRKQPHEERSAKLAEIVTGSSILLSQTFEGPADRVADAVSELGLEGVIAKRRDSTYESGERSSAWVKLVFARGQEFVVGGYTRGTPLQSLVVGYYDGDEKLICVGKVPGGLNPANRRELHRILKPLEADVCPFANLPNAKKKSITGGGITAEEMKKIQWVTPQVVAQVAFRTWTPGGNIRHSVFKGLRHDKAPKEIVREVEQTAMA